MEDPFHGALLNHLEPRSGELILNFANLGLTFDMPSLQPKKFAKSHCKAA